ncbi:MAG: UxaA family hydrolase, partial [Spirochaetaceae bacterium]|nr:UxaA family hydrolase [Spirochaetaceae bacterium]
MNKAIIIKESDNVAVCLKPFLKGESIEVDSITLVFKEDVPQGHKVAIAHISKGENIIKYGYPIGSAKADIEVG